MIQSQVVNGNEQGNIFQNGNPTWVHQLLLFVVAAVIIVSDQASKWWVEANLAHGEAIYPFESIREIFRIVHVQNTGVAFGFFQGGGWIFTIIAFIVAGFIIYFNTQVPSNERLFRFALGLQLGGALGNVIDRFRLGHVTDFVHFNLRPLVADLPALDFQILNWPVFNVADTSIVTGVFILAYLILTEKPDVAPTPVEETAADPIPTALTIIREPRQQPQLVSGDPWLARFILITGISIAVVALSAVYIIPKAAVRGLKRRRRRRQQRRIVDGG